MQAINIRHVKSWSQIINMSYCLKVSICMLDVQLTFLTSWFRMACQWSIQQLKRIRELLKHIDSSTEEEWAKAAAVCQFLKAFEELTLTVSAHRKPTSHRFLPLVLCILDALKDPAQQSTHLLKELAIFL